jgi:hypothetical protein
MGSNLNPANSNEIYWTANQTSSDEYQPAATPANLGPWSSHKQEQTLDPQGAPRLTEIFDGSTHNLRETGAGFYNRDVGQYIPMPEDDYASRETPGVEGTHANIQGFASSQE